MAKVRPLSLRGILMMVRKRPVSRGRGVFCKDLYLITEMELKALASAFRRRSKTNRPTPGNDQ